MQLLVQKVIYDKKKSAVQIALRPLPEAWGDLNCLNGVFYHRTALLPLHNSHQTDPYAEKPVCLHIRISFGLIFGNHGRKDLVPPEIWEAYWRRRKKKTRTTRPPAIQRLLLRATQLKQRLDANFGLTRLALAKELDLDPSRITQILNLLSLAPQIQTYIRNLPSNKCRNKIGDGEWMRLARIRDHNLQVEEFKRLLNP